MSFEVTFGGIFNIPDLLLAAFFAALVALANIPLVRTFLRNRKKAGESPDL